MIIAIDYDHTFSADPEGWSECIRLMQARGHEFVCITGRSDLPIWREPVEKDIKGLIPIVFAGDQWKDVAAKKNGWKIDVWIDDMPTAISRQPDSIRDWKDK